MKTRDLISVVKFQLVITVPASLALLSAALFFGCQKTAEEPKVVKPQVTIDNLQTAYGKTLMRVKMYSLFTKQAEKERLAQVARMYKAMLRSEEIHAALHAKLLREQGIEPVTPPEEKIIVGTTSQTLKMAQSVEEMEFDAMYPNLLRTAVAEKYEAAVEQFTQVRDADARHGELAKEAIAKVGKLPKTDYFVCPQCGYIMTSEKTETCPVCKTPNIKFEKI